ncbi:MAG: TauD/TfdA family dioxygenase [Ilumatobacter sp.]|uniref:TauD/TfdA family dioxygenase n=1 Tax=Ilumatobacter sp. TaxID=1967498 RepID=UPI003C75BA46
MLRRADDAGKVLDASTPTADEHRPLIEAQLTRPATPPVSAAWARDACRCPECRDVHSGQHLIEAADLAGWHVIAEHRSPDGLTVDLLHADGRCHRAVIPNVDSTPTANETTLWGSEHVERITSDVADASGPLDRFVSDLAEFGIAVVGGVPTEPGAVLDFARSFGFVRTTNYGELFDVRPTPNASNLAFTSKGLPLHTDNPYRDPVPTVQLLHCLRAARTGGASMFSDGFAAAERLRQHDPASFRTLTTTPVSFRFRSADTDLVATTPLIQLDVSGNVTRVTVNNRSMEPVEHGGDDFYAAYLRFCDELAAPDRTIELTLGAGQLVAFDNRRVLHGRGGHADDAGRHLQGCYADIDAVHSAVRVNRRLHA